jgi:hypothetical protein
MRLAEDDTRAPPRASKWAGGGQNCAVRIALLIVAMSDVASRTLRCRIAMLACRDAPAERPYFWQEVRSFSSIEKIAPASILMLRTRQARPVVSFKLAS